MPLDGAQPERHLHSVEADESGVKSQEGAPFIADSLVCQVRFRYRSENCMKFSRPFQKNPGNCVDKCLVKNVTCEVLGFFLFNELVAPPPQ